MESDRQDFAAWFNRQYLDWQYEKGRRTTLKEFAEWLDIPRPLLSHYLNGRNSPSIETTEKIALKLGPEIYDVLGLARPDPLFVELRTQYDAIPPRERTAFLNMIREWASERGYTVKIVLKEASSPEGGNNPPDQSE